MSFQPIKPANGSMVPRAGVRKTAGSSGRTRVARQHSAAAEDPRNFTAPHPEQMHWSLHNLPDILYQLHPVETGLPEQKVGLKGIVLYDNQLRDLPVLPDHISSNVEEWRVEAWMRLDKRVRLGDITDRMHPAFRISNNTLQQRNGRFRQEFHIISWYSGNKKSAEIEAKVTQDLIENNIDPALNTTRGLTPGLINPALGEEGGRIPFPGSWSGLKVSKPPRSKAAAPVRTPQQARNTAPQNMNPPAGSLTRTGGHGITQRPANTRSQLLTSPSNRAPVPTQGNVHETAANTPVKANRAFNNSSVVCHGITQQVANGTPQLFTPTSDRRPGAVQGNVQTTSNTTGLNAAQALQLNFMVSNGIFHQGATATPQFSTPVSNGRPAAPATVTHAFNNSPVGSHNIAQQAANITPQSDPISNCTLFTSPEISQEAANTLPQLSTPTPNGNLFFTPGNTQQAENITPATAAHAFNNSSTVIGNSVTQQAANSTQSPATATTQQHDGTNVMGISFIVNVVDDIDGSQALSIPIGDGSMPIDTIIEKLVQAKSQGYQQVGQLDSFGKEPKPQPATPDNVAAATAAPNDEGIAFVDANAKEYLRMPIDVLQNLEKHPHLPMPADLHPLDRDYMSRWAAIRQSAQDARAYAKQKHHARKAAAPALVSNTVELDNEDKRTLAAINKSFRDLRYHKALDRQIQEPPEPYEPLPALENRRNIFDEFLADVPGHQPEILRAGAKMSPIGFSSSDDNVNVNPEPPVQCVHMSDVCVDMDMPTTLDTSPPEESVDLKIMHLLNMQSE